MGGRDSPIGIRCVIGQLLIFFCVLQLIVECSSHLDAVVMVQQGRLKGLIQRTRDGREYYGFLGVPYASIGVRFEAPEPYPSWDGIRDATHYGPVCPQLGPGPGGSLTVIGDEQLCLNLNIFTPNVTGNFPVIIYFHGGALMTGAGSLYGASYFLDFDVIIVTINYRLGALGFLSTHDTVIQGNAGLKDQNMALRWAQTNLHSFGGDNNKITIMGESAGAASVAYHLLSPMSKNLFHGAIMQSGSVLDPQHFEVNPREKAVDLAESLDCPTGSSEEIAECLRIVDYRKIVQIKMTKWHLDPLVQYPPTLEKLRQGQTVSDVFLTEDPFTLLEEGRFNKVPCVIGIMEQEGLLFHSAYILRNLELQRNLNLQWNYIAPITLYYENLDIPLDQLHQISRTIRGFYFGNQKVSPQTSTNLTNLYSDRLFNWGARSTALFLSRWVPVYAYIHSYLGEFSMLQLYYGTASFPEPLAPTHGDDLQYFFNSSRYPDLEPYSRSEEMSRALVKLWGAFSASGNMLSSLDTLKIAWLPIGPEEIRRRRIKWCFISTQSKILAWEPFTERMQFWDKITEQMRMYRHAHISQRDKQNVSKNDVNDNENKDEL